MSTLTGIAHQRVFKNAIFKIAGSRRRAPTLAQFGDIGERAAFIARRSKVWKAETLYTAFHCERYLHLNNGVVKYGISERLYRAVLKLAEAEALRGVRPVVVYARGVRTGAVVFGRSRKCAWRKCRVHFVSESRRKYCSQPCERLAQAEQRKQRRLKKRREKKFRKGIRHGAQRQRPAARRDSRRAR